MHYHLRIIFTCLFVLSCTLAGAQGFPRSGSPSYKLANRHGVFSFSVGAGVSSYFGDLKDDNTNLWLKPGVQLGVQYRLNNHLHIRTEAIWYRISGTDSLNEEVDLVQRNLSFRSDNFELNVVGRYELFNKFARSAPRWNPYGFAGLGLTTVNPEALYNGEWVGLRPLMTEGEEYSSVAMVIPFGLGLSYHINRQWDISLEYGYRYALTDYLDDVSTTYPGAVELTDPMAIALSNRSSGFYEVGDQRGNPGNNDWYLITALKVTYTPSINYRNPRFR